MKFIRGKLGILSSEKFRIDGRIKSIKVGSIIKIKCHPHYGSHFPWRTVRVWKIENDFYFLERW